MKILTTYIIALHVIVIVALTKSDLIEQTARYFGKQPPELSHYYHTLVSHHQRQDSQLPADSIIFIGDSHIQGLATTNFTEPHINYGIGSDTTVGVLKRLALYTSINNAKAVLIHIGVNDLKRRDNQTIINNIEKIVNAINAKTPLIISSLLPVDEQSARPHFSNKRIQAINSALKTLKRTQGRLIVLRPPSSLLDNKGQLLTQFHNGDGLHLNERGYNILSHAIRESLGKL